MERKFLVNCLEALLLSTEQSLSLKQLEAVFEAEQLSALEIKQALVALAQRCQEHSYELRETASGYRLQTRSDYREWVLRLQEEKPPRYSRALLETLALIAWRQPITRAEIEEVRGVAVSSHIIRTLQEREWIRQLGHKEVPGRPALWGTTRQFLDYFNLKSLDDLPNLADLKQLPIDDLVLGLEANEKPTAPAPDKS